MKKLVAVTLNFEKKKQKPLECRMRRFYRCIMETLLSQLHISRLDVRGSHDRLTSSENVASCLDGGGDARFFLFTSNHRENYDKRSSQLTRIQIYCYLEMLKIPWLSHLCLSCVRTTPRPWNAFSILMSAACGWGGERQAALASFASLFDSFVKLLEEDHDAWSSRGIRITLVHFRGGGHQQ